MVGLLGAPVSMWMIGFFLLARIRAGFTHSTRKRLFAYYVCLLAYCGFWLAGSGSHDGVRFTLFHLPSVLAISLVISIPAFVTMFTKPEPEIAQEQPLPHAGFR